MTVGDAIVARLAAVSGVTALVANRIHLMKSPQSPAYPLIVVTPIQGGRWDSHLRGGGGTRTTRVQVSVYAHETPGVNPYAKAHEVVAAMDGDGAGSGLAFFKGGIGSPAFEIDVVLPDLEHQDAYVPDEIKVVTSGWDYMVHWRN